ncbi:hypothetical protein AD951_06930 [Acetobacter malorum]|uniref:Uncharacterized protein n=1 Tax=Acetobacter malorum TaxID=178901 RepID=A0A149UNH2_9PROT|nr:hypothetical protein AD951_06930 [Acetobacter malorum]
MFRLIFDYATCVKDDSTVEVESFYRRVSTQVVEANAVIGKARKIAVLIYNTHRYDIIYVNSRTRHYHETPLRRIISTLH